MQRICKNFVDAGQRPEAWITNLSDMEPTTVMMLIDEANFKLAEEARVRAAKPTDPQVHRPIGP